MVVVLGKYTTIVWRIVMALLIDGYNLLHVSGVFGSDVGPATFQRARTALLNFLAAALEPEEIRQTTIVFDAREAPPGLPDTVRHQGIEVRYARGYDEADELLEELIAAHDAARDLTVVSSDHRVQRAARRRRAEAVDSDIWWNELSQRRGGAGQGAVSLLKPDAPLSPQEVQHWLDEFGDIEIEEERPAPPGNKTKPSSSSASSSSTAWKGDRLDDEEIGNPFPPGYGEDLLEENDE